MEVLHHHFAGEQLPQAWTPSQEAELSHALETLIKSSIQAEFRENFASKDTALLRCLLSSLLGHCHPGEPSHPTTTTTTIPRLQLALNCGKLLRNLCAGSRRTQNAFGKDDICLLRDFLCSFPRLDLQENEEMLCLLGKTFLQLLGNLCVNNERNQCLIWDVAFPILFTASLRSLAPEEADVACMILHTCTAASRERMTQLTAERSLLPCILRLPDDSGVIPEWTTILLQSAVEGGHLGKILTSFPTKDLTWRERHTLLAVVEDLCLGQGETGGEETEEFRQNATEKTGDKEVAEVAEAGREDQVEEKGGETREAFYDTSKALPLSDSVRVKEDSEALVKEFFLAVQSLKEAEEELSLLVQDGDSSRKFTANLLDTLSYARAILALLCNLTGRHGYNEALQMQEMAVRVSIEALKLACRVDGTFSGSKRPTRLRDNPVAEDDEGHPLFSFKSNLVCLLGNLAHRCPGNQTLIGQLEGVHLVLNHFRIDHVNPYITQWSAWAFRNLCEGHPGNQAILSQIEKRGPLDLKSLEENGFEVEVRKDGKIGIKMKSL